MLVGRPVLLYLACVLLLFVIAFACSSDGEVNPAACPQPCPANTVCNPTTGRCDPVSQAGCSPACTTANTYCSAATRTCECNPGYADCNGDKGDPTGNGCECYGPCNGTQCGGTTPPACQASVLNDCGEATRYCDNGTCTPCPAGSWNCDGVDDCESATECGAGGCELYGANSCASQDQYCDQSTEQCTPCPPGTYNCDRGGGDCECTTGCDGSNCRAECTFATGCGDEGQFCDFGKCTACPTGKFNCDGRGGCECDAAGCDGTQCAGERFCDYLDTDNPCGSPELWCYQNECRPCTDLDNDGKVDYYNCNGTGGCECDAAGCNGTQCAGKCYGGECP